MVARDFPVTASLALGSAVLWLVVGVGAGDRGDAAAVEDRSRHHRDRARVLLNADVPARTVAAVLLVLPAVPGRVEFFPPGLVRRVQRQSAPVGALSHPAVAVDCARHGRHLLPPHAERDDRRARQDYVRTARAKGLTERRITYRHALRSSLTPVVTQFGIDLGGLMGGAIVTEVVFALPGLGREAVQAVTTQDLPIIMGIAILSAVLVVAANLAVDLCHALVDPRVRVE